jgi:uncharacterized protein (TIGR03437 family)
MTIRQFFVPLTLGVLSWSCASAQQYTISTYAGNGTAGFSGDSGAPKSAELSSPGGIALDSSGNLYIADSVNQRVRKISGGAITTVAGNGTAGFAGDKAAATSANLRGPSGVAVDSSGNLYIADTSNHVIRMVTSGGTITTVAGNNTGGYAGDGAAATNGELRFPGSVAVDSSGNIYIADSGNDVIRKVSGGNITTIATNQQLNDPATILVDSSGNLYIADSAGLRVMKYSTDGTITFLAGSGNSGFSGDNGPAIDAALDHPQSIALDAAGYLYITDTYNSRIRKVSPDGIITTIAGAGIPAYSGDGGPATNAALYFPRGVAVNSAGNVYISDTGNNVIRLLQPVTPAIAAGGVVNAASFAAQVSPGALATVFGSNFTGSGLDAIASLPLPASLGGVSVKVNGVAAHLLYSSSNQINFQIPWETKPGSAPVIVTVNGLASKQVNVTVQAAAPGLFVSGSHAIVQNYPDYSLNSSSNPVKASGTIIAYLTGAGAVSNQPADGAAAGSGSSLSTVTSPVSATIGGQNASVSSAALAPGFVGLWQANIVVPSALTQGDFPLIVSVGGQASNSANVSVTP